LLTILSVSKWLIVDNLLVTETNFNEDQRDAKWIMGYLRFNYKLKIKD